jgi:hypothetical protein
MCKKPEPLTQKGKVYIYNFFIFFVFYRKKAQNNTSNTLIQRVSHNINIRKIYVKQNLGMRSTISIAMSKVRGVHKIPEKFAYKVSLLTPVKNKQISFLKMMQFHKFP